MRENDEQHHWSFEREANVGVLFFAIHLLEVSLHHVFWVEALLALVVKKHNVSRVERLLDGVVGPVPPVNAVVLVRRPSGVLLQV